MTTVQELLRLNHGGVSRSEARLLLAHRLGVRPEALIMHPEKTVENACVLAFCQDLEKAEAGYPIPYLTGLQAFWGRDFVVTPAVLIPRPDTETLVEAALHTIADKALTVLELGTGSGCIAVTLALEKPKTTVVATDISEEALTVARENARRLQADNLTFRAGEWFGAVEPGEKFDLIVSNPPYIAEGDRHLPALRWEPVTALTAGVDGLDDIRRIAAEALFHLRDNGVLAFEHGYDQGAAVRNILQQLGYRSIVTLRDLGDNDRVTQGFVPNIA